MKRKIIKIIRILGIGYNELVIDIETNFGTFNSIEWVKEGNKIWLHMFTEDDDFQLSYDFDDLEEDDKYLIYLFLSSIAWN
jgi:hypothetical protein